MGESDSKLVGDDRLAGGTMSDTKKRYLALLPARHCRFEHHDVALKGCFTSGMDNLIKRECAACLGTDTGHEFSVQHIPWIPLVSVQKILLTWL